jgi:hypothetical protein
MWTFQGGVWCSGCAWFCVIHRPVMNILVCKLDLLYLRNVMELTLVCLVYWLLWCAKWRPPPPPVRRLGSYMFCVCTGHRERLRDWNIWLPTIIIVGLQNNIDIDANDFLFIWALTISISHDSYGHIVMIPNFPRARLQHLCLVKCIPKWA